MQTRYAVALSILVGGAIGGAAVQTLHAQKAASNCDERGNQGVRHGILLSGQKLLSPVRGLLRRFGVADPGTLSASRCAPRRTLIQEPDFEGGEDRHDHADDDVDLHRRTAREPNHPRRD